MNKLLCLTICLFINALTAANDSSETTIYMLRHGQTNSNLSPILQSHLDVPLNHQGRLEARTAALLLPNSYFDVCYSSPLSRAAETASIIVSFLEIPISIDDRIIERFIGSWGGRLKIDFANATPEEKKDVETDSAMMERTFSFLNEVARIQVGKKILVISHCDVLANVIRKIENRPSAEGIAIPNCGLIILKKSNGRWSLQKELDWLQSHSRV